jgi:integrase
VSIGKYPGTTCEGAFRRYDRARMEVQAGRNPAEKRRELFREEKERERIEYLTVNSLFYDHFLPRYAKVKKRTWINDELYFRTRINPAFGDHPANAVTPGDIERLLRALEVEHHATARLTLATLRKMYNWASEYASAVTPGEGPLLEILNPCRHYKLGAPPPPPMRVLKHSEIRAIWNRLGKSNSDRIIRFQFLTGCRVSEAAGMRELELDREAMQWVLPAARSKNGRSLVIPLTALMLHNIGPGSIESEFVFPASSRSGHTTGTGVLQAIKRYCRELGIEGVGTHTLRKTFITQMATLNVSREVRDRLTNHADPSVDARHYNAHDYLTEKLDALRKWETALTKIVSPPIDNGRQL